MDTTTLRINKCKNEQLATLLPLKSFLTECHANVMFSMSALSSQTVKERGQFPIDFFPP